MGGNLLANQALRLLDECQDSHDSCQRRCTPLLPNRVIDVGPSDSNPRLYVTAAEQRANYTTLSYCWGGAQQLTTTKATFNSRTLGIPMTCLPQTIQDAIIITRNLNIRFLWVDAICIIQDDERDQATEIRGMGAIYKQATLTIAAMSSENAYRGFIKKSVAKRGSLFPFLLPNGTLGRIELVVPDWYEERPLEKLETRAWAFQEFLLSPRLLLFHQREAFWQCQSPGRTPLLGTSNSYATSRSYRLPNDIFSDVAAGKKDPLNDLTIKAQNYIWSMIVSDYSGRHVQFEKDRFHAIAGIVNELKDVWQDTYLAGFWKKPLVHHLAWYRDNGALQSEPMEPSSYDTPSWSWLSVNCPVAIYRGTISPDAEVIDCTVEPMDATLPEGPLRSGTLTIEGAFLMASEIPDEIEIRELHEIMIGTQSEEEYTEWENNIESEHNFYIGLDRGADEAPQEVIYLRLGSLRTHHGGYDADSYIGLILEETTDEGLQPCFKRIGRWEHFMKEEDIMTKWADAQRKTFCII
ncbi:heterokaryon incompatibility protein [Rutstroemia sp. NJR-2017a BVV2]|nr:heterokaryon incompatibility protein [Rutstroemia sp. NJR-2017a BVV2]